MRVDLSKPKVVALYCRVAREDDKAIGKQASILRDYAKEHGYTALKLYVDNGVSGIGFDRPALNRLERHISVGRIKAVMVTEISRVSRNALEIPGWIDRLRCRGISFIAVKDGITGESFDNKAELFQRFCEHFERQENQPPIYGG